MNYRNNQVKEYLLESTHHLSPIIAEDPIILEILARKYNTNNNNISTSTRKNNEDIRQHKRNDTIINKTKSPKNQYIIPESNVNQKNINNQAQASDIYINNTSNNGNYNINQEVGRYSFNIL